MLFQHNIMNVFIKYKKNCKQKIGIFQANHKKYLNSNLKYSYK